MNPHELESYLHEQIPLSQAMAVRVVSVSDDGVVLGADLAPNINHRETLFGGSASAIAILAAWSLVHTRLHSAGMARAIVIRRNSMKYEVPVDGDFTARSYLKSTADWQDFFARLDERGMAKIEVAADLECQGKRAGQLSGEFVAFDKARYAQLPKLVSRTSQDL